MTWGVNALVEQGLLVTLYIERHTSGDWGDVCAEDKKLNDDALASGYRLVSAYNTTLGRILVITEADRSSTMVMLPEEY